MADRWQQIESLCHAALARPANEREAFLAEACQGDAWLRAEVDSLLARAASAAPFLEHPAIGAASGSLIGRQLGAYRIESSLGAGGMGEVYRAKDTRLGRAVALKVLPGVWAADEQRRSRFEREARAVAALNHPNICIIHDVGSDQGIDYLVMELVDGETLAARLEKAPLPLDQVLALGIEIADALDKAHGQGIVHRDLKPGNIMLARSGSGSAHATHAKLLDFGLARIIPSGLASVASPTVSSPMTEAGAMLGTLQYMAPEQLEGRPADARTDIFAFGALLYEMVTGRRAFEGATSARLMASILRENPQAVHPRDLDRIVKRCLEKDPLRRYQSTRDLVNDLEEVKADLAAGALATVASVPVQTRVRRSRAWWLVPAVAVAGIGIVSYGNRSRPAGPSSAPIERFQLQPPSGVEVQAAGPNSVLAISPDGRWIAFRAVSATPNQAGLYLRSIGEIEAKQIAPVGAVPFFSPDSRWLGFVAENAMYKVPVGGGLPDRICQVPNVLSVRGASWSEDDKIVFSLDRALWRVSSTGGTPAQVTYPDVNTRHFWPQVLPGGTAAVFTLTEGYNDRWRRIALVSLNSGVIRTLPDLSGTVARYVPSGHLVFSRFGVLHAAPFDISRLEVTGQPAKVLDNVHTFLGSGSVLYDVSAAGSLVYSPGSDLYPDGELLWLHRDGTTARFDGVRKPYIGAAIDPSGTRLAAAIASDFGEGDLWVLDLGSGARSQLTTGMHAWSEIVWSRDGKWIYFTSFKSGEAEIYRVPSAGGDPVSLTSDVNSWEHPSSVSPDGKTLLYWRTTTSQSDLMALPLEPRGTPSPITDSPQFSESTARLSPSGLWIAYVSDETGSTQVHVRSFTGPGAAVRVSPDGGTNPWWSGDGRALFYQRGREIWAVPVNIGQAGTLERGAPRVIVKAGLPERSSTVLVPGEIGGRFVVIRRERPERRLVYVPNWVDEMKQTLRTQR